METSIEALLSRKRESEETYPIAKQLATLPIIGPVARSWMRATKSEERREQLWAVLPRVVA